MPSVTDDALAYRTGGRVAQSCRTCRNSIVTNGLIGCPFVEMLDCDAEEQVCKLYAKPMSGEKRQYYDIVEVEVQRDAYLSRFPSYVVIRFTLFQDAPFPEGNAMWNKCRHIDGLTWQMDYLWRGVKDFHQGRKAQYDWCRQTLKRIVKHSSIANAEVFKYASYYEETE